MQISIGIAAYNEEKNLPRLLKDLCAQDYPKDKIELVFADGCSRDGTRALLERFAQEENGFRQVVILENKKVWQAPAHNLIIENFTGDALIKVDAHASLPPDFISSCARRLESEKVCGGPRPCITDSDAPAKRLLLTAESSMFGSGFAIYRRAEKQGYVILAKNGVKELILIAQDTSRYGKDLYGEYSLDKLLEKLVTVDGIKWIRVHYFYPEAITDSLIDTMAKYDKICNYIDMPVQHGNNEILRRMARRTTQEQMVERINKIREKMPDCTIRTSIIVGFPGETEEQFNDLYEFVKKVRFDRMGAFTYSQEEDTPAADFPNQVDEEIKEERLDRLMTLQQGISLELNKAKLGKTLEVLVEGYDEESFLFYGRSRGDSIDVDGKVYFATEEEVTPGDIIKVKILDADEYDLTGQAEVI